MTDTPKPVEDAKDILALDDRKAPTPFYVHAWDRSVLLRDPMASDRDEWDIYCTKNQGKRVAWRAKAAQILIVNSRDERIFTEDQIGELSKKSARALHEIWNECTKRLAVTDGEIKELEKN